MKKISSILINLLFIGLSNYIFAQSMDISDLDQLLATFEHQTQEWKEAYNSGDARNLTPLYTENACYVSSHVAGLEANGRDAIIANFQHGMSAGGHIDSIIILSVEISKDLATLFCSYQAKNSGETVQGRNLIILRKVNGKWLIVLHMTVV